jgi:hypothetical protein
MKFQFCWLLAAALSVQAMALETNSSSFQQSGGWASQVNQLGNLQFSRAFTIEDDAVFAVDSQTGSCDRYKISLFGTMDEVYPEDQVIVAQAKIRVDNNRTYVLSASLQMERGDSTLAVEFNGDYRGLYEELMAGDRVRLELSAPGEENIYGGFSLHGSTEALKRADSLCRALPTGVGDSSYFSTPPPARNKPRSDADFF